MVDGFTPSNSAAPPGPETFPLVRLRGFMVVSRSWRFNRVREPAFTAGFACSTEFSAGSRFTTLGINRRTLS